MYLGAYQLGDRVPLSLLCRNSSQSPALPDAAPAAVVCPSSGGSVATYLIPPVDLVNTPGLFERTIHLDARYSVGRYAAQVSWQVNGDNRAKVHTFDILPGGHPDGAIISMFAYHCPQAEFLIQQTDGRKIIKGRNPTV